MRSTSLNAPVVRLLGAFLYFGVVVFTFLQAGDWGQPLLFLVSVTAGLLSGRWWSVAFATLVMPAAAVTEFFSPDESGGDSVSGPLDAALFAGLFVLPMAAAIALGVGVRRLGSRLRGRAEATPT